MDHIKKSLHRKSETELIYLPTLLKDKSMGLEYLVNGLSPITMYNIKT